MFNLEPTKWEESHGVNGKYSGVGGLYFTIPYMLKAKKCVILGSGGGYVPKMVLSSQQTLLDEKLIHCLDTTLVDADTGKWGRPDYKKADQIHKELKLVKELTSKAVVNFNQIDYLHIDADHSYAGVLADLNAYLPKMSKTFAITIHDTYNYPAVRGQSLGCWKACLDFLTSHPELSVVNFKIGCGTALIMPIGGAL